MKRKPAKDNLLISFSTYGNSATEIFAIYSGLEEKFGSKMKDVTLDQWASALTVRFKVGLQQLMTGSRTLRLSTIFQRP